MITLKINDKEVVAEEGQTILQVARQYNIHIPTLCYHEALSPAGACRLCTVEVFDGRRTRLVTSCNYPVWRDMEVRTDSERVIKGRRMIVELLLARCPGVKVLQDLAREYGIEQPRFAPEADDCILCGLCTRMCEERMGVSAISLTGRGVDLAVDTPFHLDADICRTCGACAFGPAGPVHPYALPVISNLKTSREESLRLSPQNSTGGWDLESPSISPLLKPRPMWPRLTLRLVSI